LIRFVGLSGQHRGRSGFHRYLVLHSFK